MNKLLAIFALPLLLLAGLSGCGGGDSPSNTGNTGDATMKINLGVDLSTVRGFVIAPTTTSTVGALAATSASDNRLYSIGTNGVLTVVSVTENGTSSTATYPTAVFNTPLYVFFSYVGVSYDKGSCGLIAARKSDAALFCIRGNPAGHYLSDPPTLAGILAKYFSFIQSNPAGNIVWINGPKLVKLDMTNPSSPTQTEPFDSSISGGRNAEGLAVNSDGDGFVAYIFDTTTTTSKVAKANGGFFNVNNESSYCLTPGLGSTSNDFYFVTSTPPSSGDLKKMTKNVDGTFSISASLGFASRCQSGLVRTSTGLYLGDNLATFTEVIGDTPTAKMVPGLSSITKIAGNDTAIMILGADSMGNSGIVRYTILGGGFTVLVAPNLYTISKMEVSATGDTTFFGQRASDGAYILGNVAAGSTTVDVLSQGLPSVTQLVRIN